MYYLKHEHECFIRYKMRGAVERFIADKARNAFKQEPRNDDDVDIFLGCLQFTVD